MLFRSTIINGYMGDIETALTNIQTDMGLIKGRIPENKTYETTTTLRVSDTVYTGTVSVGVTGSVKIFNGSSATLKSGITIKSLASTLDTSDASLLQITGNSSATGIASTSPYYLSPGEVIFLAVSNTDKLTFNSKIGRAHV